MQIEIPYKSIKNFKNLDFVSFILDKKETTLFRKDLTRKTDPQFFKKKQKYISINDEMYNQADSVVFFPSYKNTGWGDRLEMRKNLKRFKKTENGLEFIKNKDKQGDIELLKDWIKRGLEVPVDPTIRGEKNLIYFTIFGNEYVNLLNCLLKGLIKQEFKEFELLLITDRNTKKVLLKNRLLKKFQVNYHLVKSVKDGVDASVQKIKIFDYKNIKKYSKILFLDLDILIVGNVKKIFDQPVSTNILYSAIHKFSQEIHKTEYHTISPYSENQIRRFSEKNIFAFNAGQFFFLNTPTMQIHFNNIKNFINMWNGRYFFEQSFMNTYFNVLQISNVFKFMDHFNFISINSRQVDYVINQETVFIHYMGSVTDAKSKILFMKEHYAHLLP
jgi:hypothetical protein